MSLKSCPTCKKLFHKFRADVCPACELLEEEYYERVREHISQHTKHTAEKVSEETAVPLEFILRLIRSGRVEVEGTSMATCGKCGAPAISSTKRLCQKCLGTLSLDFAKQTLEIAPAAPTVKKASTLNTYSEK
ncbi:MAG TPA: hypothetical protein PLJ47_04825 [Candidatus Hydrogenedentes bacterium]|nr:hypothetical protein [Candidatus Hydrogenedentota bacterium]